MIRKLRRLRWRRVLAASLGLWLLFNCALAAVIHLYGQTDGAQPADVIIVLGAGLRRDGRPGPALQRRSQRGAELWRAGVAPSVICTGGVPRNAPRSEADACREILEANGVPPEAIVVESRSRSTQENAFYAQALMQERGWRQAVLVSDGYHLLRAHWIFSTTGVSNTTSPAVGRPRVSEYVLAVARELVALHWQAMVYLFNLPVTFVPWV